MIVQVYSDYVCPWCYIGLRKIEQALAELPSQQRPAIRWRAFQLDANASDMPGVTAAEAMKSWYPTVAEAESRMARIVSAGRGVGIELKLEIALPVNTMNAHRLTKLAETKGLDGPLRNRLFRAYHTEGRDIANIDVLSEIAADVGISPAQSRQYLQTTDGMDDVSNDRLSAAEKRITGVPSMVIGSNDPVSVIRPPANLRELLQAVAVTYS